MFTRVKIFYFAIFYLILFHSVTGAADTLSCHDCTGTQCTKAITAGTSGRCTAGRNGRCFIRLETDGTPVHGCADTTTWAEVDISYVGCRYQNKILSQQGQSQGHQVLWCLCDTRFCNTDISYFNARGLHSGSPPSSILPRGRGDRVSVEKSNFDLDLPVARQRDVYSSVQPPIQSRAPVLNKVKVSTMNNMNVLRELSPVSSVQAESLSNNQLQPPLRQGAAAWPQNSFNLQDSNGDSSDAQVGSYKQLRSQQTAQQLHPGLSQRNPFARPNAGGLIGGQFIDIQLQSLPDTNQFQPNYPQPQQLLQPQVQPRQQETNQPRKNVQQVRNQPVQYEQKQVLNDRSHIEPEYSGKQDLLETLQLLELASILTNNYDDDANKHELSPSLALHSIHGGHTNTLANDGPANLFPFQQPSNVDGYQIYVRPSTMSLKESNVNPAASDAVNMYLHAVQHSSPSQLRHSLPQQRTRHWHRPKLREVEKQNIPFLKQTGSPDVDLQQSATDSQKQSKKLKRRNQQVVTNSGAQPSMLIDKTNALEIAKGLGKRKQLKQTEKITSVEPASSNDNFNTENENTNDQDSAVAQKNIQLDLRTTLKNKLRQKLLEKLQLTQSNVKPPTVLESTDDLMEASIPIKDSSGIKQAAKSEAKELIIRSHANDVGVQLPNVQETNDQEVTMSATSDEAERAINVSRGQGQGQDNVAREFAQVNAPELSKTPVQQELVQQNAIDLGSEKKLFSLGIGLASPDTNTTLNSTVSDEATVHSNSTSSGKEEEEFDELSDAGHALSDDTGDLLDLGLLNRSLDIQNIELNLSSTTLKPNVSAVPTFSSIQPSLTVTHLYSSASNLGIRESESLNVSTTHSPLTNENHLSSSNQSTLATNQKQGTKFPIHRFLHNLPSSLAALFVTTTTELPLFTNDHSRPAAPLESTDNLSTAEFRNLFLARAATTVPIPLI